MAAPGTAQRSAARRPGRSMSPPCSTLRLVRARAVCGHCCVQRVCRAGSGAGEKLGVLGIRDSLVALTPGGVMHYSPCRQVVGAGQPLCC